MNPDRRISQWIALPFALIAGAAQAAPPIQVAPKPVVRASADTSKAETPKLWDGLDAGAVDRAAKRDEPKAPAFPAERR